MTSRSPARAAWCTTRDTSIPGRAEERGEHAAVRRYPACGRHRVHHRAAGQFVAEADPIRGDREQAALLGRGERGRTRRHQRLDEPALHRRRHDGEPFDDFERRRIQPRQLGLHSLGDRQRHRRGVTGGQHLRDEVRVAGGHREDLVGVEVRGDAQPAHRGHRQRVQAQAADPLQTRGQPDQLAQRVVAGRTRRHGRSTPVPTAAGPPGAPGTAARRGLPHRPSAHPRRRAPSGASPTRARRAGPPPPQPGRHAPAPGSTPCRRCRSGPVTGRAPAASPGRRSSRPGAGPPPAGPLESPQPHWTCRSRLRRKSGPPCRIRRRHRGRRSPAPPARPRAPGSPCPSAPILARGHRPTR